MIAQTIQLALAPVFVLVAIGNFMNVLTGRLGRIVDRSRHLQSLHTDTQGMDHDAVVRELRSVDHRIKLINRAILFLVVGGIIIALTVGLLFVEGLMGFDMEGLISATFFGAVLLLVAALITFLRETRIATADLRIPETFLELDRKL